MDRHLVPLDLPAVAATWAACEGRCEILVKGAGYASVGGLQRGRPGDARCESSPARTGCCSPRRCNVGGRFRPLRGTGANGSHPDSSCCNVGGRSGRCEAGDQHRRPTSLPAATWPAGTAAARWRSSWRGRVRVPAATWAARVGRCESNQRIPPGVNLQTLQRGDSRCEISVTAGGRVGEIVLQVGSQGWPLPGESQPTAGGTVWLRRGRPGMAATRTNPPPGTVVRWLLQRGRHRKAAGRVMVNAAQAQEIALQRERPGTAAASTAGRPRSSRQWCGCNVDGRGRPLRGVRAADLGGGVVAATWAAEDGHCEMQSFMTEFLPFLLQRGRPRTATARANVVLTPAVTVSLQRGRQRTATARSHQPSLLPNSRLLQRGRPRTATARPCTGWALEAA
jgi:hypothetical protein